MKGKSLLMFAAVIALSACLVSPAMAQTYKSTFVHLGQGVPGVLYEPLTPGPKAEIAVLIMHSTGDYLEAPPCSELAKRGYRTLCANCSTAKSGFRSDQNIDKMVLNVKLGVAYLRKYPGVRKVVLYGHSGGGGLMSAYQNIAENGVEICQGPEKVIPCPDSLAGLPAADGVMLIDSTLSQSVNMLFSLDPAVALETGGKDINPELDAYNPKNGFNPKGSTYSDEFKQAFFAAQKDRMNQLIDKAQDMLAKIKTGKGNFDDDEPFVVPGADPALVKLFSEDVSLLSHTRNAWPLLHPNGAITTEIIHTVRVPRGNQSPSTSLSRGATMTTARTFLSTFAVRPTKGYGFDASNFYGIDFKSNYCNTAFSVEGISVPLLQMGMTGSYEYAVHETIREHAKSADKTLAFVEGAVHGLGPCKECAAAKGLPAGYYGDTIKTLFDYADGWLSKPGRF